MNVQWADRGAKARCKRWACILLIGYGLLFAGGFGFSWITLGLTPEDFLDLTAKHYGQGRGWILWVYTAELAGRLLTMIAVAAATAWLRTGAVSDGAIVVTAGLIGRHEFTMPETTAQLVGMTVGNAATSGIVAGVLLAVYATGRATMRREWGKIVATASGIKWIVNAGIGLWVIGLNAEWLTPWLPFWGGVAATVVFPPIILVGTVATAADGDWTMAVLIGTAIGIQILFTIVVTVLSGRGT